MFQKLDRFLSRLERVVIGTALLLMTAITFVNTMLRYGFNVTFHWAEDTSVFLMICMTFFAGAYGTRLNSHITMNALYDSVPPRVRKVLYAIGLFICALASIFLLVMSWQVTRRIREMKGEIAAMDIPAYWPYLIASVGILFMSIHFIQLVARFLRSGKVDDTLENRE